MHAGPARATDVRAYVRATVTATSPYRSVTVGTGSATQVGAWRDPGSVVTRAIPLDVLNLVETVTETLASGEKLVTITRHDAAGNAHSTLDHRGIRKEIRFDPLDRPLNGGAVPDIGPERGPPSQRCVANCRNPRQFVAGSRFRTARVNVD